MFLEYGIDQDGELVYIDQVHKGKTLLNCPYCNGPLLARKGDIKAHHFAHAGETCKPAKRNEEVISLPAYDRFNLSLPHKVIDLLNNFHTEVHYTRDYEYLQRLNLVDFNPWNGRGGDWELTKKGKMVLGELSLMLFCDIQERMIRDRYAELHRDMLCSHGWPDAETYETDLRLYCAQWRRILSTNLYFLSIDGEIHKIGVTTRSIEERIEEIRRDLLAHRGAANIQVLGFWPHRGNVELYFKYRYKAFNQPVGALTEYFRFEDVKPALRDLRRMKPKVLDHTDEQIIRGEYVLKVFG